MVHQRLLAGALEAAGYTSKVVFYPDAERALMALNDMMRQPTAAWPAFAIIDVGLPGISGIELVDRLRRDPMLKSWPVVMLTASEDPEDRSESLLADATAYYAKPSTGAGYKQVVNQMLDDLGARIGWPAVRHSVKPTSRRVAKS